jgi:hypothetical protein
VHNKCVILHCSDVGMFLYPRTGERYCRKHYHERLLTEAMNTGASVLCVEGCLTGLSKTSVVMKYIRAGQGECPRCHQVGQLVIDKNQVAILTS